MSQIYEFALAMQQSRKNAVSSGEPRVEAPREVPAVQASRPSQPPPESSPDRGFTVWNKALAAHADIPPEPAGTPGELPGEPTPDRGFTVWNKALEGHTERTSEHAATDLPPEPTPSHGFTVWNNTLQAHTEVPAGSSSPVSALIESSLASTVVFTAVATVDPDAATTLMPHAPAMTATTVFEATPRPAASPPSHNLRNLALAAATILALIVWLALR